MEHILFIDDEPRVLHSIKLALHKENYIMHFASNAKEAFKHLLSNKIAVIVSDHKMPEVTGVELLNKARKLSPYSVRIMLTGECNHESTLKSINLAQVFKFIQKPFDCNALKKILNKAITTYQESLLIADLKNGNIGFIQALQRYAANHLAKVNQELPKCDLKSGMKLRRNLYSDSGILLMKKDKTLTLTDVQHIQKQNISSLILVSH